MESVLLVIHLILALAIIGLVLMQRSEGGGLGIGGGGGGAGNFASPRGTASFLTRATAICAVAFFTTSLTLGIMAGGKTKSGTGILSALEQSGEAAAPIILDEDDLDVDAGAGVDTDGDAQGEINIDPDAPAPAAPIAD
jgi:preprotein translocase subunit SecG